jgi:hypothetical protein
MTDVKLTTDKEMALVITTTKGIYHLLIPANSSVEMKPADKTREGKLPEITRIRLTDPT